LALTNVLTHAGTVTTELLTAAFQRDMFAFNRDSERIHNDGDVGGVSVAVVIATLFGLAPTIDIEPEHFTIGISRYTSKWLER
jgi:hypothetical protein